MRLSRIKLSGFKSFVDPTNITFPSNMVGVVGPNGCGKSNVIDAVRWVMGESSPKTLRGESMTDVIFNGSTQRKPVDQATVELIFDNSDHSLGGQYAQYSEISIRRQVTREGQSQYYLNNVKCRRRDITDVFLGTGLGPRSYSIIEQGMVSRLVEAKPEELRVYLEEAAGISKYKERRRETENRIRHTKDNLSRLNDLRDELEKQLNHLQQQAKTAEKYAGLQESLQVYQAQLIALRWQSLERRLAEVREFLQQHSLQLESTITDKQGLDLRVEKLRAEHSSQLDVFNEIQKQFYGIGADVARLEQQIQSQKARQQQLMQDIADTDQNENETKEFLQIETTDLSEMQTALNTLEPKLASLKSTAEHSRSLLETVEHQQEAWQKNWDAFNEQSAVAAQQAQVSQTKIQHIEQQIANATQQQEKLRRTIAEIQPEQYAEKIQELTEELATLTEQHEAEQSRLATLNEQLQDQRLENQTIEEDLESATLTLQETQTQYASLKAIQESALGKNNETAMHWLKETALSEQPRLAEQLQVVSGWEHAVETVLAGYLEAVCVDALAPHKHQFASLTKGCLTLIEKEMGSTKPAEASLALLSNKVTTAYPLASLLDGIYCAESLDEAYSLLSSLKPNESVVARDGTWMGRGWVRLTGSKESQNNTLVREQELLSLQQALEKHTAEVNALQDAKRAGKSRLFEFEEQRESLHRASTNTKEQLMRVQSQLQVRQNQQEQLRQRKETMLADVEQQSVQKERFHEELAAIKKTWQAALTEMDQHTAQRATLTTQRDALRLEIENNRKKAREDDAHYHQSEMEYQTLKTKYQSTSTNKQRLENQLEHIQKRKQQLSDTLGSVVAPIASLQSELERHLTERLSVETQMNAARAQLEEIEHQLTESEKQRQTYQQLIDQQRETLQKTQLENEALVVRQSTLQEQLSKQEKTFEELLASLPEGAEEEAWQSEITTIENRIQRLGPINLAAISEYETQSERKVYLDQQNADLMEALATLENAIQKIDRETKARFKETYDLVNNHFKEIFPKVFNGGSAYLELTGEELLETGIAIMARPPGKRNSTIHLLSGGEKALTAIALVFAIFQLNPAPFCMLDEVDAPLDDANVTRYCELVKQMSEKTQFIFISHNKVTMEMAEQLMGVTMQEPGVSRLVSVDIKEAVALAE